MEFYEAWQETLITSKCWEVAVPIAHTSIETFGQTPTIPHGHAQTFLNVRLVLWFGYLVRFSGVQRKRGFQPFSMEWTQENGDKNVLAANKLVEYLKNKVSDHCQTSQESPLHAFNANTG
jgi:hypothetical protein